MALVATRRSPTLTYLILFAMIPTVSLLWTYCGNWLVNTVASQSGLGEVGERERTGERIRLNIR